MACSGVVKITHPGDEKFGLLELGQFLLWVCAPIQGMVSAVGFSRTLCPAQGAACWKGQPLRQDLLSK